MDHRISIVTVNYDSREWLKLLQESIEIFSSEQVKIIVIDNSEIEDFIPFNHTRHQWHHVKIGCNIGHGHGLNIGSAISKTPYTMFLDVDCHFLTYGWEKAFISKMEKYDVIGGKGVRAKPIRPACMFLKTNIAQKYDWRDTHGYKGHRVTPDGMDVAISAYYKMLKDNVPIDFIESISSRYKTLSGEEWCIEKIPYVYHHWHGTHLSNRQIDFEENLQENKEKLFKQIPWRLTNDLL